MSANLRRRKFAVVSPLDSELRKYIGDDYVAKGHWKTIRRHVIRKNIGKFSDIPNLPVDLYPNLELNSALRTLETVSVTDSPNREVTKILFKLQDGNLIESVILRYGSVDDDDRVTLCISSQIGCRMGCSFCATGTMGLIGSLTDGEILEQLMLSEAIEHSSSTSSGRSIRNVVFMGMGEPLDNYEEVVNAIHCMLDPAFFNISPKRITVSTVGVLPKIRSMIQDIPDVSLALSLHSGCDETRRRIVPSASNFTIDELLTTCDEFVKNQHLRSAKKSKYQKLMIEYILIKNVNCDENAAHQLGRLLTPRRNWVMINVIPYNPTDACAEFEVPTQKDVETFVTIIRDQYSMKIYVRREMGQAIDGACGQLVVRQLRKRKNGQKKIVDKGEPEQIYDSSNWLVDSTSRVTNFVRDHSVAIAMFSVAVVIGSVLLNRKFRNKNTL